MKKLNLKKKCITYNGKLFIVLPEKKQIVVNYIEELMTPDNTHILIYSHLRYSLKVEVLDYP